MKHLLLFTTAICLSINLFAQVPVYNWAKGIGEIDDEMGTCITVDVSGNVYTTGYFWGTMDFDPDTGTYNLTSNGWWDIFILKFDANGNFIWAKSMGGPGDDRGFSITTDLQENIYTTGYFIDTVDFDPGPAVYNLFSPGNYHTFILKLDSAGNFIWAKSFNGSFNESTSILVNGAHVYTTGTMGGTVDFNPGPGAYNLTSVSNNYPDIYISKLDTSGSFKWARIMGGANYDRPSAVALDMNGNVYTAGWFYDIADFDPGPGTHNLVSYGFNDIFISKLNSAGNFVWAKRIGGPYHDHGLSLAVSDLGDVYTTGHFSDTVDFNPGTGVFNLISSNGYVFISKLNSGGNFVWAKSIGGSLVGYSHNTTLDSDENIYMTGYYYSWSDFDPGPGTYNLPFVGVDDIFLSKLDSGGNFVWAKGIGSASHDHSASIALDANKNVYITGFFSDTADFNAPFGANLFSHGQDDVFIAKYSQSGVGMEENNLPGSYTLFPNPTHGDFTIQLNKQYKDIVVRIFNIAGQKVLNAVYQTTNTLNINFGSPAGIYFVEIRNAEGITERMKVVKID